MRPRRTVAKYWFAHVFQLFWCLAGSAYCALTLFKIIRLGPGPDAIIGAIYLTGLVFSIWLQIHWGNRVLWEPAVKYALNLTVRIGNRLFP
mgnify:CR=1 FL=1